MSLKKNPLIGATMTDSLIQDISGICNFSIMQHFSTGDTVSVKLRFFDKDTVMYSTISFPEAGDLDNMTLARAASIKIDDINLVYWVNGDGIVFTGSYEEKKLVGFATSFLAPSVYNAALRGGQFDKSINIIEKIEVPQKKGEQPIYLKGLEGVARLDGRKAMFLDMDGILYERVSIPGGLEAAVKIKNSDLNRVALSEFSCYFDRAQEIARVSNPVYDAIKDAEPKVKQFYGYIMSGNYSERHH